MRDATAQVAVQRTITHLGQGLFGPAKLKRHAKLIDKQRRVITRK